MTGPAYPLVERTFTVRQRLTAQQLASLLAVLALRAAPPTVSVTASTGSSPATSRAAALELVRAPRIAPDVTVQLRWTAPGPTRR